MFTRILIANRGEIACRIISTARRIGVETVAVYSDSDIDARHVGLAYKARRIGPPEAGGSYLHIPAIIEAARAGGAEAIHPGYGFLAESPRLARACKDAGLTFIGPPAEAMAAMGSKIEAKAIMKQAGIPVVPGYHGEDQKDGAFRKAAGEIGYPVLIKASAGGGGKGMRIVEAEENLEAALDGARREANASFGDGDLLLEKYLPHSRHVEIQVFADSRGNTVHLFERDCSIQRRHQKIIEEAPAPHLSDKLRQDMTEAAVEAARAIGYVGAGTVECLVAGRDFYFNEMNTRLQVEHPVTEMITGLDLVEWQLRVASGEALPRSQDEIRFKGHAVEARLYAEDPANDFLPATGRIAHLRLPAPTGHVRLDMGVIQDDTITRHYDPLLGKLIVRGENREAAVAALQHALSEVQIAGLRTNVGLLQRISEHSDFLAGRAETDFIDRHREQLLQSTEPPQEVPILAAAWQHLRQGERNREAARSSADPWSPWAGAGDVRLNGPHRRQLIFRHGEMETAVVIDQDRDSFEITVEDHTFPASSRLENERTVVLALGDRRLRATVIETDGTFCVFYGGRGWELTLHDPLSTREAGAVEEGAFRAPMPGRVLEVRVGEGDRVSQGMALVVLEAMKMEHTITAHGDGVVQTVMVRPEELVDEGDELLVVEAVESEGGMT